MSPRGRTETATEEDIIQAAKSIPEPPFGAKEIAEQLPIGRERARQKLEELTGEDGPLAVKRIGRSNVYWFKGH